MANCWRRAVFALLLISITHGNPLLATPDIRINGLFKDRAILAIDGKVQMLKVGQTKDGITLVSCNSDTAVVEFEGQTISLGISRHISSGFQPPQQLEVRIPRDDKGHYFTSGYINGRPVEFMVDTGATNIAMNLAEAQRLGINFRRGELGGASTAGGVVNTFYVTLPKVTIGAISLQRVRAAVIIGDYPREVLLGNSFLKRVEMQEQDGVLVLRKTN